MSKDGADYISYKRMGYHDHKIKMPNYEIEIGCDLKKVYYQHIEGPGKFSKRKLPFKIDKQGLINVDLPDGTLAIIKNIKVWMVRKKGKVLYESEEVSKARLNSKEEKK